MNIFKPIYKRHTQINQYEVTFFGSVWFIGDIVTVEVSARNYATAKDFVEENYHPKQIYSICLIEDDILRNKEGCTRVIWWRRKNFF